MVRRLVVERRPGLFHVTNQGAVSWYEFAREVLAAAGLDPERVQPIATADLDPPRPAPRPANSVLDNAALRLSGVPLARRLPRAAGSAGRPPRRKLIDVAAADAVRLVVLNHDGGAQLERCVTSLLALDWPRDELDIVVVDNASSDASADDVERRHPEIRVERNPTNLGFPGNNTALRDLAGVRYVGLVNNDAFVEPGWLAPLVDALDAEAELGAVNGTLLFDAGFVDLRLEGPSDAPSGRDRRRLGVRISGVRVDGEERGRSALVVDGGWGPEPTSSGGVAEWTQSWARMAVPVVLGEASRPAA